MVAEALECLGGNGYVEENGLARLYREAPLNSIWEGSGNVNALDVLRAVAREPASVEALPAGGRARRRPQRRPRRGDRTGGRGGRGGGPTGGRGAARRVVEHLAVTLQAALLVQHAPHGRGGRLRRQPGGGGQRAGLRHAGRRRLPRERAGDRRPGLAGERFRRSGLSPG